MNGYLFYNSLRELGGASTLYRGDITSRLKLLASRDGVQRRFLSSGCIREISARYSQGELSRVLDELTTVYKAAYAAREPRALDVAAASNIIEVGVDIDRLSLMGVLGQPKTTAQYIQVTGRVGRKWQERPGLVLMLYNSSKARDLSHFEQFHSYHRRLYERVEPTSATPFTSSAVRRALGGLIVAWLRHTNPTLHKENGFAFDEEQFNASLLLIKRRAKRLLGDDWAAIEPVFDRHATELKGQWKREHDTWYKWTLGSDDRPVVRTYDQYATGLQMRSSFPVPTSLRQVDRAGRTTITEMDLSDILQQQD